MNKNTSSDVRTSEAERVLHKNCQKVLTALQNEPFGLSIAQIANNTRLSVKTVRNVLSGLGEVNEDGFGVFTIKGSQNPEKNNSGEPHAPVENSAAPRPAESKNDPNWKAFCDMPIIEQNLPTQAAADETALENMQLPIAKPEAKTESHMPNKEEILTAESVNTAVDVADPFEQYKSMVETVTIEKKSVSLNAKQLSRVLQDLFGLKNVQFFAEGQSITRLAVQLSDEVVL